MKDSNYYMSLKYKFVIKQDEDGSWFLKYPDLQGCMTCAPTLEEVIKMGEDAKAGWIELALEDGREIPEPKNIEDYSGEFRLRIPKSLHKDLVTAAEEEKTSLNQYCLYLLSKNYEKAKLNQSKNILSGIM